MADKDVLTVISLLENLLHSSVNVDIVQTIMNARKILRGKRLTNFLSVQLDKSEGTINIDELKVDHHNERTRLMNEIVELRDQYGQLATLTIGVDRLKRRITELEKSAEADKKVIAEQKRILDAHGYKYSPIFNR